MQVLHSPKLSDVMAFIYPFLAASKQPIVRTLSKYWNHPAYCSNTPLTLPWAPVRRRLYGFGKQNPRLSISHQVDEDHPPSPFLMLHHAWPWLTPQERNTVCTINNSGVLRQYAILRGRALHSEIRVLRVTRSGEPPLLVDKERARMMSIALLRFDFVYADLIRWLAGEYTNRQRDWNKVFEVVSPVTNIPPLPTQPPIQYARAYHLCTQGAPIAGEFQCTLDDVKERVKYDNHPGIYDNAPAIRAKFAKEEHKSFHIFFMKWCLWFIFGIHICPLRWALQKGKDGSALTERCLGRTSSVPPIRTSRHQEPTPTSVRKHTMPLLSNATCGTCTMHVFPSRLQKFSSTATMSILLFTGLCTTA